MKKKWCEYIPKKTKLEYKVLLRFGNWKIIVNNKASLKVCKLVPYVFQFIHVQYLYAEAAGI